MKLVIFGATGRTGQELVTQALERHHEVTAFARTTAALTPQRHLRVAHGDARDAPAVAAALRGQDAALVTLGSNPMRQETSVAEATHRVIDAMEAEGVRRLIVVSALGAGDSRSQHGVFYNVFLLPVFLRNVIVEKETQEEYVRKSHLDWTIVRPGALTDGGRTGVYRVALGSAEVPGNPQISRADLAEFMLKELGDGCYVKQTPGLFY